MPLIKNPSYQPPKPITLNTNYSKLIPSLSSTSIPPKINLSEAELQQWSQEIDDLKNKVKTEDGDVDEFENWVKSQQNKVAPGFNSFEGVMKPSKVASPKEVEVQPVLNELDKAFGNTSI